MRSRVPGRLGSEEWLKGGLRLGTAVVAGVLRLGAVLLVSAALLAPATVRADAVTRDLETLLAALEEGAAVTEGRAQLSQARRLGSLRQSLEKRYASQRAAFEAASRRDLPAKALGRLEQAREAHAAGQGRLLELLRALEGAPAEVAARGSRAALLRDARELVSRMAAASRQEPLSAELKMRAPALVPLSLPGASGAVFGSESSMGAVPPSVKALAESLSGPIEAYAWVRNTIRSEFYYGSLKGPAQTLLDGSGNDADTASLLIGLLRAQGVPARFAQGTAQVDVARLQAVTGTASPEQAVRVLERAGIPHEPVLGASGIASVKIARVWVEAYVPYANYRGLPLDAQGKLWLPLDAAFKDLRAPGGIDVVSELGLDPTALAEEYLQSPRAQTPREFLRTRVGELLAPRGQTYEQALNDRSLMSEEALGILPNALPYALAGPFDVSYDAPLPHELQVVGEHEGVVLVEGTFSLPATLGRRLTLSYVPFDADDAQVVEEYGGLQRTPPYLIEVKAVLRLGGIAVAVGEAPVGMAVRYDLRLTLSFPGGREEVRNKVLAGNLMAIGLAGGDAAAVDPPGPNAAALLARAASEYLRGWNRSDAELANVFRVVPVRPTASSCFVMSDFEVEYAGGDPLYPVTFDWKGVAVDADLRASSPAGIEDRAAEPRFNLFSGLEGSILENRLFEDLWQVGSISTAKALQVAGQAGIPILTLTRDNVEALLPGLPLDEEVKEEIRDAALRGFTVRVPEALVSFLAWTGSGWWILDEETGESAWQLQGGHSGGVTAAAVIDWPDVSLTETLQDQGEEPAPEGSEVTKISKFVSTDFQDGVVDKPLGRPFRVLVNDEDGLRVPNAQVTFQVIGGGGVFLDPETGEPGANVLTVLSNARGEAEATLVLGKRTDEIPRFACFQPDPESCSAENEIYATQVGLNLVTAFSGTAHILEPFLAYSKPDDRFDGTYIYANLSFKTYPQGWGVWNLTVAGLWAINVRDQHENPLSNFRVRFAYRPPPVVGTPPPGWQLARPEGTQTPGKLLKLRDYVDCIERTPSPTMGDCAGEQEELIVPSSTYGSVSYPILGDSPYSRYYFDFGTEIEPNVGWLGLGTWGWLCSPSADNWWCRWPDHLVDISSRPVLVGPTGNLIEAYPPGETAPLSFTAHALYEGYIVTPYVDSEGTTRYRVRGDNTWKREPLDDTVFNLTPNTEGTGVQPSQAGYAGGGKYEAEMAISGTPQLNKVDFEARSFPLYIPQDLPDHYQDVDPAAVDETTLEITKRKDPDRPWIRQGTASLWGVRASVDSVTPDPIRIHEGRVIETARVAHTVEPAAYLDELAPTNLWFLLERDENLVLAGSGTDGSPFEIPAGLNFPPGDYTAKIQIPGVQLDGEGIESPPFPIRACQPLELLTPVVLLPYLPDPQTSACETQREIRFRLCAPSRVTITIAGQVLVARLNGIEGPIQDRELDAGEYVLEPPREFVLAVLGDQPAAPFRVLAVPIETPRPYSAEGAIGISNELITLRSPVVDVGMIVDYANGVVCRQGDELEFAVCDDAKVTIKVDGQVLSASIDGGPIIPLDGITLSGGAHTVLVPGDLLALSFEQQKPFRIEGELIDDPSVKDAAEGWIQSRIVNRTILPLSHTFVRGVDIADGHVAVREVDLSVPGRHLGLEMSRTYSSASSDMRAPMGAGWNWVYGMSLDVSTDSGCELVVLTTRDGTQVFRGPGPNYTAQKGYHGRLIKVDDATFDYFDKANIQHRFQRVGFDPSAFRIEWIQEPHGDRLVMSYGLSGRLEKVVEEQDGAPVREMRFTYKRAGSFDRVETAEIFKAGGQSLGLKAKYEYDENWGNLLTATRYGTNIGGGPRADDRVHRYRYSENDQRDRHQLSELWDPNGNRTRFQYYTRTDVLPGEETQRFFVLDKEERVRAVYEYPDTRELKTEFTYDLREGLQNRIKTTVEDPAGRDTLYVQDTNGSVIEIHEPLGKDTFVTWTADIRKETVQDANGRVTRYTWDGMGNPESETIETGDPDLGDVTTTTTYDPTYSKLVSRIDAEDQTTSWTLDPANGDVLEMRDAEGNRTIYDYVGGTGMLRRITDVRGSQTEHEDQNDFGQPRRMRDAEGNVTQRTYDDRGRLVLETDSMGRRTEYVYDGLDRLRSVTRHAASGSDDEVTRKEYYPGGQLLSETNANGGRVVFDLDGLNRVKGTTTFVSGRLYRTETTYDRAGNKETETDRRGVRRRFEYDSLNRLKIVSIETGPSSGPTGEVATYDYDLVGNPLFETDVAGNRTDYEYDGLYRVKTKLLAEAMPAGYSPSGRLKEEYRHDKVGNRISVKDANGRETQFEYDRLNRLKTTIRDVGGLALRSTIRYCNAPAGDPPGGMGLNRCEEHDVAKGLRILYEYDGLNRETKRTVRLEGPDGDSTVDQYVTTTEYMDSSHEVHLTDPNDNLTIIRMDGLDRPIEQTVDAGGLNLATRTSYDSLGKPKLVLDPRDNPTQSRFDGLGRLTRLTDAKGASYLYDYDGEGLRTFEEDRRGVKKRFEYDNLGRQVRAFLENAPFSGVSWSQTTDYRDREHLRIETNARGKRTTLRLDGLGRVIEETDHYNKTAFTTWDGVNRVRQTDKRPAHHVMRFEYDGIDRITRTVDPAPWNYEIRTRYLDSLNQVVETDRRGTDKVTQLDSLGRVRSVTGAAGQPEEVVLERNLYDGNGNKTRAFDAENRRTDFVYDGANRLSERTDGVGTPAAATTRYQYDGSGNLTLEQDQRARDLGQPFAVKREYDVVNRPTDVFDGEGHHTVYDYDREGNRTLVQEPKGQRTRLSYGEMDEVLSVTQAAVAGGVPVTRHEYDENRNRTKQTDGKGNEVVFQYDDLDRVEWMIQEGNRRTHHEYDENGNEIRATDPNGNFATNSYDELNRLQVKEYTYASGPELPWRRCLRIDYDYDPNGNLTEMRESVASGTDPPAPLTTSYAHDRLDRQTSETAQTALGQTTTVGYSYYANGLRKTVTDAAGAVTFYEYDGQNRLLRATTDNGTPDARATEYAYWPDGLVREVLAPNGVKAAHRYDKADRLKNLTNTRGPVVISSYGYDYDLNGNRIRQVEVNGGLTETTTYAYDALNRLERVVYPADSSHPTGRTVTYGYDLVGNRTLEREVDGSGSPQSNKVATFDALNRLESVDDTVDDANDAGFTYDENGNLRTKTTGGVTTTYVYDATNRLAEVRDTAHPAPVARFQYDGDGRRILKIGDPTAPGDSGTRQFVHDGTSLLQELDSSGAPIAKYEWGSDRLVSLTRRAGGLLERRYYSFDALGSVTNLTDESGVAAASYHLDAWGNFRFPAELQPAADALAGRNRFAFTGHYFDTETELYYAKARYFDPEFGRFLSQDSYLGEFGDPPSLHRYLYANANPLRYFDPTGLAIIDTMPTGVEEGLDESLPLSFDAETGQVTARVVVPHLLPWNRHVLEVPMGPRQQEAFRRLLAFYGNDPNKALAALKQMRTDKIFRFATITIEEKDYDEGGNLKLDALYTQFLQQVGTFADETVPELGAMFVMTLEGAQLGETRDISALYSFAYATSWQTAYNHVVSEMGGRANVPFWRIFEGNSRAKQLAKEGKAPPDVEAASDLANKQAGLTLIQTAAMVPAAVRNLGNIGRAFRSGLRGTTGAAPGLASGGAANTTWARSGAFSDEATTWTSTRAAGTRQTYQIFRRTDVNWNQIRTAGDARFVGKTNLEAARAGVPPQLPDGNFATLHHVGQNARGPLVEASTRYHGAGKPGQQALHSQYGPNRPHPTNPVNRQQFNVDTREYWRWRASQVNQ